jgi:hypothetical protein
VLWSCLATFNAFHFCVHEFPNVLPKCIVNANYYTAITNITKNSEIVNSRPPDQRSSCVNHTIYVFALRLQVRACLGFYNYK